MTGMEVALSLLLNRIGIFLLIVYQTNHRNVIFVAIEVSSHTNCILTGGISILNDFPGVRSECKDQTTFSKRMVWGVDHGCALFVLTEDCLDTFLQHFLNIHDISVAKYEKKTLVVVDIDAKRSRDQILSILRSNTVTRWLPLTLVLQPSQPNQDEWINIWSAFPFSEVNNIQNRYFIENYTLDDNTSLVPNVMDLGGIEIVTALFEYPPFVSIKRVVPGSGNANLHGSNETLSVELRGIEGTLMVEFCRKFNCVISARLEYNKDLWGWGFANHTGTGILGAVLKYDADLTGAGCYLMGNRYDMIQYTRGIQRSSAIHVLPMAQPLPFWHIPILPFPTMLWTCIAGVLVVGSLLIYGLSCVQYRVLPNLTGQSPSLIDFFLTVLQMSLFQNASINNATLTNTIIYTSFLMYSLMIGNLYISGLSSVMTVTPYEPPIDTLQKLVNSKYSWGGNSITWIFAIKESTDPVEQTYVSKFRTNSDEELQRLLKTKMIAVIADKTQGGTISVTGMIDRDVSRFLMVMREPLYIQYTALIASKTWPYMAQLNRIAFMQHESGVRTYWEYKTVVSTMDYVVQRNILGNMKAPTNSEPIRLSVPHILGAGFILLFGYLFAAVVLTIEILYKRHVKDQSLTIVTND